MAKPVMGLLALLVQARDCNLRNLKMHIFASPSVCVQNFTLSTFNITDKFDWHITSKASLEEAENCWLKTHQKVKIGMEQNCV